MSVVARYITLEVAEDLDLVLPVLVGQVSVGLVELLLELAIMRQLLTVAEVVGERLRVGALLLLEEMALQES